MAPKYKQLTTSDRKAICYNILSFCEDGVPARGTWAGVAAGFSVDPKTVARLWKDVSSRIKKQFPDTNQDENQQQWLLDKSKGLPDTIFASGATNRRKGMYLHDRDELKAAVKAISSSKRRKVRHLASALDLPTTTVHRLIKEFKVFKRFRLALSPKLTTGNKHLRVMHCLEKIDPTTRNRRTTPMRFVNMFNETHVDEKWFFICRDGESYVLVSDEEEPPVRYVKHKSHRLKTRSMAKPYIRAPLPML